MAESGERSARAFDQPFLDAFPELRDAVVEYEISGRDIGGATTSYGRTAIGVLAGTFQGRIPCPHPQCHGGGFEIERIVDQMVKARQEAREGVLVCPGWIGDSDRVPCVNSLSYTVVLFFRPRTPREKPKEPKG
ncbi:MAG TPA: hypothetical protein VFM04_10115 [Candidatus Methylomirabilis sp.]|nr:hypothetical protein [Candidatus Methylomirabilis sp.]